MCGLGSWRYGMSAPAAFDRHSVGACRPTAQCRDVSENADVPHCTDVRSRPTLTLPIEVVATPKHVSLTPTDPNDRGAPAGRPTRRRGRVPGLRTSVRCDDLAPGARGDT
jgi:hypothetical protein